MSRSIPHETHVAWTRVKLCYRSSGLGRLLMSFHAVVAEQIPGLEKVMLTCFVANRRARAFYEKLGYAKDEISPEPRNLRFGKVFVPDYVIMSLPLKRRSGSDRDAADGERDTAA